MIPRSLSYGSLRTIESRRAEVVVESSTPRATSSRRIGYSMEFARRIPRVPVYSRDGHNVVLAWHGHLHQDGVADETKRLPKEGYLCLTGGSSASDVR